MSANTMESLRNTGRTTRMLEEAIRLARDGEAVAVIGFTAADAERLRIMAAKLLMDSRTSFIEDATSITLGKHRGVTRRIKFAASTTDLVDMQTLTFRGIRGRVFFDHAALERQFSAVLHEIHRWDT